MYSPKISEDLIPRIYRAAKQEKIPMTRWVNRMIQRALPKEGAIQEQVSTDTSNGGESEKVASGE
jgi:hypothetical protein